MNSNERHHRPDRHAPGPPAPGPDAPTPETPELQTPATPTPPAIGDVTRLLEASSRGDHAARDRLIELLYTDFRRMARSLMASERPDHTLGATAVVSEAYLRLFRAGRVDDDGAGSNGPCGPNGPMWPVWPDRGAFFAAAATAMRRVLIDHARARGTLKRGGPGRGVGQRVEADAVAAAASMEPADFLALDEAIQRLEHVDSRAAQVTRMRFFAGLDLDTVAQALEVSPRTAKRDWEFARAWLRRALDDGDGP